MPDNEDNNKVLSYKNNKKVLSYCAGAGDWRKVVLKFCGAAGSMSSCSGAGMHPGMRGVFGG